MSNVEMRQYFPGDGEKTFGQLSVIRAMVAEQQLTGRPCPLLESQLEELIVYGKKLVELAQRLHKQLPRTSD